MSQRTAGLRNVGRVLIARLLAAAVLGPVLSTGLAAQNLAPLTADDLKFSVENMDSAADPAVDFYRYSSGAWLDRVQRPQDSPSWGSFEIMVERLVKQMALAAANASREAATAPKGSAEQLVGDFYNSFMDTGAIDAAGIEPIREFLDRIEAVASFDDLTRLMAEQEATGGPVLFAAFAPGPDPADSSRFGMFSTAQTYGVHRNYVDLLHNEPGDPRVSAYRDYVAGMMKVAGYSAARAQRIADLSLEIEIAIFAGQLSPEEGSNPSNRYSTKTYEEVQALIPDMDMDLYFSAIGYPKPKQVYMYEPRALSSLAELWRTTPLEDLKDYVTFRTVNTYAPYLTTRFKGPALTLTKTLQGSVADRPRSDQIYGIMTETLGHPAGQVYVKEYFPEQTRDEVLDMVDRIRGVFRDRIETRDWLSEETRATALEKVDAFYYKVGYPDAWVDYSSVDIGPDLMENVLALAKFNAARLRQRLAMPIEHEEFNSPSTLPIIINAGYSTSINGFEVTAAIIQPPIYSSDMDPALRFCRAGAVIGHEMTHGFDSGGRQFDAHGNFRDWWTPADAAAFNVEAQKLIDQANAFEVLPGLAANGALNVKENMADVGGITLAHQALMEYLAEHPEENTEIDSFTQEQRCFIGWSQLWTMKAAEPYLRAIVATDGHPPNFYRSVAALQHVDAFYAAFGINEGDPMWLPPELRVSAW